VTPFQRTRIAIAFTTLILVLVLAFGATNYDWAGWQASPCYPGRCFCEATLGNPIRQPADTYSNLAYVLVGALILAFANTGHRVNRMSQPAYARLYGIAILAVGIGSTFYHGSLTVVGNWFDVMGMYLVAMFLVLYALVRLRTFSGTRFAIVYAAINAMLGIALVVIPAFKRDVFAALILIAIALEGLLLIMQRPRIEVRYWLGALALFATAYVIWILDNTRVWCDPTSWLQGHAIWHLLGAGATGLLFVYYRSEEKGAQAAPIKARGA
jgi:dihydroceramidase